MLSLSSTRTVLIGATNPDLGMLISRIIKRRFQSSNCMLSSSGAGLLEAMNLADIDLVITDEWLPDMSAYTLSQNLKRRNPHLPVLLLTALPSSHLEAAMQQEQVDAFLTKPFHIDDLTSAAANMFALAV
ncbi:MAG: response regulator [Kouleothrix sp.]